MKRLFPEPRHKIISDIKMPDGSRKVTATRGESAIGYSSTKTFLVRWSDCDNEFKIVKGAW
jgi:hypothetical protein